MLDQRKRIAGLVDWPVHLVPVAPPRRGPINNVAALQSDWERADRSGSRGPPGLAFADSLQSISSRIGGTGRTFAHELAHYLLSTRTNPIPGGDPVEELFTISPQSGSASVSSSVITARYAGHVDEGGGRGWFVSGWQGYLGERMLMTALTVSEMLAGRDPAQQSLTSRHIWIDVRTAHRYARVWICGPSGRDHLTSSALSVRRCRPTPRRRAIDWRCRAATRSASA